MALIRTDSELQATTPSPAVGPAPAPDGLPRVEVVRDAAGLEALTPAWRALLTDRQFFVGPDWVRSWLEGPGRPLTPHVLTVREGSRLVGVLPLAARRRVVSTCGADEGLAHVDVVAEPGRAAAVADLVLAHLDGEAWARWRVHRVAEGGALHAALRARADRRPVLERFVGACPYVEHHGDWASFLKDLSKHQRHEATRQLRRFFEGPDAAVRWVTDPADVDAALDVVFDLHKRRFEALGKPTAFARPEVRAFHGTLARRLADRNALMLGVLSDGGRPVAAAYGAHLGGTTSFFNAGIDPAFARAGAGVVLRCLVLKDAVLAAGRHELDLLEGCQEWKLRWATGVRPMLDVDVFPASVGGRVRGSVRGLVRALKARAAAAVHAGRGPGSTSEEPADPKHCRRLGCPYAPPAPPCDDDASV
ncbi:MAG: GNAT family N-acetyltransferase [Planctomycetia bacterium]|nr:GNAT family N-acetyltransferase [Planctomycetia bacterium]